MVGRTNSGSGGGALIKVVGGTTRPANPLKNTVWINTSTSISSWVLTAEEPTTPEAGMVWIILREATDKVLTVGKSFIAMIGGAKQYVSDTWEIMTGAVYINGTWLDLKTRLYFEGDFNPAWEWVKPTRATMYSEESDHLHFTPNGNTTEYLTTATAIDLTDVSTINFDVHRIRGGNQTFTIWGILVSRNIDSNTERYDHADARFTWYSNAPASSETRTVYPIDVSALAGKYYITIIDRTSGLDTPAGGQMDVYGIELI